MIEPVSLADFFTAFFSAAMVIITGAVYALLFAFARVKRLNNLLPLAYLAYIGLVVSVLALAKVANLFHHPFWTVVVGLMLAGYLFAPHAIWNLCVGTHTNSEEAEGTTSSNLSQPSR